MKKYQFASDNYAGICPEAWRAMEEANVGYASSYGDDEWTAKACCAIRDLFETKCDIFFVFNGTAANSLALASLCHSYHSIICHESAHVETDECGASEFFSNGTKLLLVPGENGKIDLDAVTDTVRKRSDIHFPKPKALSVTQATELGTVYSAEELGKVGETARSLGLKVHMDGARFMNAVASIGASPAELTWKAGVDVLCMGGTKGGMAVGEAVVFFNHDLAHEFDYRCKQAGQLASKMRFLSAPWVGMLRSGAWLQHAAQANAMAQLLAEKATGIPGVEIMFPRQANSVFLKMPDKMINELRTKGWHFYTFIGSGGCRLMCSWATTVEDVEELVRDIGVAAGV